MKKVIVTQREEHISEYGEIRDSIDQKWTNFLMSIDLFPIFVSNNLDHANEILKNEDIKGVILTGGESLSRYSGIDSTRDKVEKILIDWAINNNVPLLGVCRGMQVVQNYFGISLQTISNHVGVRHNLEVNQGLKLSDLVAQYNDVNSFHNLGTKENGKFFNTLAISEDGIVKALEHKTENIYGVMWHCERETPFVKEDKELFKQIFN